MANLKALVDRLVGVTFQVVGDLTVAGTYQRITPGYDPVTGRTANTIQSYQIPSLVMSRFTIADKDDSVIVTTDFKAIFPASFLPVDPSINDQLITSDGSIYIIQKGMQVPGDSVQILHVRKA